MMKFQKVIFFQLCKTIVFLNPIFFPILCKFTQNKNPAYNFQETLKQIEQI